jgi:hypothetical protein
MVHRDLRSAAPSARSTTFARRRLPNSAAVERDPRRGVRPHHDDAIAAAHVLAYKWRVDDDLVPTSLLDRERGDRCSSTPRISAGRSAICWMGPTRFQRFQAGPPAA